jgi:hypothetical protein
MLNGIMLKSLPVDWVKIKRENNFVYIYARNGIKDNASFATLRNEAIKNGVFWGAYADFNMDWSVAQAPDKQARELAFLLQGNPGDLIPAFHLIPQNTMPTRDLILGWLEVLNTSFNQYFKKIPMFGTNPNTIKYLQPIPNSLLNSSLWIMHWNTENPNYSPWSAWGIHQISADGLRFNGTVSQLLHWAETNQAPTPTQPPASTEPPVVIPPTNGGTQTNSEIGLTDAEKLQLVNLATKWLKSINAGS